MTGTSLKPVRSSLIFLDPESVNATAAAATTRMVVTPIVSFLMHTCERCKRGCARTAGADDLAQSSCLAILHEPRGRRMQPAEARGPFHTAHEIRLHAAVTS